MTIRINIVGGRFGRLVVTELAGRNRHRQPIWACVCDCGNTRNVPSADLRNGHTKSCGCLKNEASRARTTKHGLSDGPEFGIWQGMLNRCRNSNVRSYSRYGGRGIKVCDRWRKFENFYADMGPRPSPQHEIDRRDNDGNYEPSNCRWATRNQQMNNRRNTRTVVYRGEPMPLTEAVRAAGSVIHYESAAIRIFRCDWPVDRAVETPPDPNHPCTKSNRRRAA